MSEERKNINVSTFQKVEKFLKKQKAPIFKTDIVKQIGVDYDSLKIALSMLKLKTDEKGRIKLC